MNGGRVLSNASASFIPTLRLEAVFATLVLFSVGWLTATPVPIPDYVRESVPPPSETQTIGDEQVSMTITPGGPGVNTYDIRVSRDNEPVDGLAVKVQIIDPSETGGAIG